MKKEEGEFIIYDPTKFDLGIILGSQVNREGMGLTNSDMTQKFKDVNGEFKNICLYHLLIGILLLVVQIVGAFSLESHYTAFLQLISIFFYQVIIIRSMEMVDFCNDLILN